MKDRSETSRSDDSHSAGPCGERRLVLAREDLREAVRMFDDARESCAPDSREAARSVLNAFPAKWTVLETFDRDGTRYVLARENRPRPKSLADIPAAERSVLECAMRGLATKEIAHVLAISDATVRVLLMRSARRCHVPGRRDLIAWARQGQP
jgi:DNA-binding NarL/FixJ family response regulator